VNPRLGRVEELGPVDAILVGGDIAFKGHPDEYAPAAAWLHELADQVGCSRNRIYVVPGNHDVDRTIARESLRTRNAHDAIRRAPLNERDRHLRAQFADPFTSEDVALRMQTRYLKLELSGNRSSAKSRPSHARG
jgi:DNA repair exonuclease SbcCD nuclease subunit